MTINVWPPYWWIYQRLLIVCLKYGPLFRCNMIHDIPRSRAGNYFTMSHSATWWSSWPYMDFNFFLWRQFRGVETCPYMAPLHCFLGGLKCVSPYYSWVVFLRIFYNFISCLLVKRGGSLSFLTIFTFAVPELLDLIWRKLGFLPYVVW